MLVKGELKGHIQRPASYASNYKIVTVRIYGVRRYRSANSTKQRGTATPYPFFNTQIPWSAN